MISARGQRIAIVGAGLAGLSAANELAQAGVVADLYEASERVGGRVHSDARGYWSAAQTSEWCGELIDTDHVTVRGLCEANDLRLVYRPGQRSRFGGYERVTIGRILFAGDHCSVDYQGFMEGAASDGVRAGREILIMLGRAAAHMC